MKYAHFDFLKKKKKKTHFDDYVWFIVKGCGQTYWWLPVMLATVEQGLNNEFLVQPWGPVCSIET